MYITNADEMIIRVSAISLTKSWVKATVDDLFCLQILPKLALNRDNSTNLLTVQGRTCSFLYIFDGSTANSKYLGLYRATILEDLYLT